jgi:hypothetical protein
MLRKSNKEAFASGEFKIAEVKSGSNGATQQRE